MQQKAIYLLLFGCHSLAPRLSYTFAMARIPVRANSVLSRDCEGAVPAWPAAALCLLLAAAACPAQNPYNQGMALFREGKFREALPILETATAQNPNSAQAWKALALTLLRLADYPGAIDPLRHACALEPAGEDSCYLEGRTLFLLARYEEAAEPLEKAARTALPADQSKSDRARALNADKLGNAAEAERLFLAAIRTLRPDAATREDPRVDYGAYLIRQGRAGDAIAPLQQALAAHPQSPAANAELGRALLDLDRPSEALPYLDKAVALDKAAWNIRMLLGKTYLRLGRSEEGERELSEGRKGWAKANQGSSSVQ
jgi:Flp pilus assembly protein TadD